MLKEVMPLATERCRKFITRIEDAHIAASMPLDAVFCNYGEEMVKFADRAKGDFKPLVEGQTWGENWDGIWVHITGSIPADWKKSELAMQLAMSGETMIYGADGVPVYALTGISIFCADFNKDIYLLPEAMVRSGKIDLWVESVASSLFGLLRKDDPARRGIDTTGYFGGTMTKLRLVKYDREARALQHDFEVLYSLMLSQPENSYRYKQLLAVLNDAITVYGDDPANVAAARKLLAPQLALPATASAPSVCAVGHAHIDVGWLWPVRESIRKAARTFSSQLALIEKYPGYVFGASQPQLYAFVRDNYPELYKKIKKAVKAGSWELQGGMWVEADCNIISGESMVRQFVHGKNFYMDEFGVDVKNLWIPDVFGYSGSMPQIIKKAGCDYFLTQKISWSQFNKFPYHTFLWRGIDGSEVLSHFPPEDTYNAMLRPQQLIKGANNFSEAAVAGEFMDLFGIGDGGGGPEPRFIERGLRCANLEGVPKVKFGRACDFFERAEQYRAKLPKWDGELYLEMHRGTLTTQSQTKRNNRKLEQLLAATEFVWSMLPLAEYPTAQLDRIWKKLLINQFHDIIPGSSIRKVYDVTEKEHADCIAECQDLIAKALKKITKNSKKNATVVNTLGGVYSGCVELPAAWGGCGAVGADGKALPSQLNADGSVTVAVNLPGSAAIALTSSGKPAAKVKKSTSRVLENKLIRYEFNAAGELISAFDKEAGREVMPAGKSGNCLGFYVDRPVNFEAWDVDYFYRDEATATMSKVKVSAVSVGAAKSKMLVQATLGAASKLEQTIVLRADSKRLDFITRVDWHEDRRMLRVSFPAEVFSDKAAFDIQYGYIQRPLHNNTSWDMAKFEVAGHRYMDISDRNYGAALLNDCKYGYCASEQGVLDLCLLRSPLYPDPDADRGMREFTYAFLPHTGGLVDSNVMAEAASLNREPLLLAGSAPKIDVPLSIDAKHISLEVVKRAEKSNTLVIRLVETSGCSSRGVLHTTLANASVVETDLMEWHDGKPVKFTNGSLELDMKPFEIRTYKVVTR
ncbi:MAG: glycoside hydrolase family 38 C-terminal domain-containing protein [Victivallaceae bacterium]|nr:glycoside hydrolase family 38 C-terminal domain-containing protein [Victivallaceae bacterium]